MSLSRNVKKNNDIYYIFIKADPQLQVQSPLRCLRNNYGDRRGPFFHHEIIKWLAPKRERNFLRWSRTLLIFDVINYGIELSSGVPKLNVHFSPDLLLLFYL